MTLTPLSSSELTELIHGLNRLAHNLWWTWNQEAQEIFQKLSPRAWQNLYHNAVAVLHEVSDMELRTRLQDPGFAQEVRSVLDQFEAYLQAPDTWAAEQASQLQEKPIAYFSAEFGLSETLPIAAGGARSSCRRSCQISERSWAALCRYQSILSSGLLHAGDQ